MSPRRQPVTIKQVAEIAGVSTQTVSRVLNNRPDVAPETREHVQEVMDELGYQPSALARRLKQRSRTLGIVTTELGQYGPMRRLLGIEQGAEHLGYTLHLSLLHQFETDKGEEALKDLLSWQVEGIVWSVPEISNNHDWLKSKVSQLPVPIVFISERPDMDVPAVSVDNRSGGRMATQHLLAQNYKHIGIITGPLTWEVARQRRLGWEDALGTVSDKQTFEGDWSATSGEKGLNCLLEQFPELDAVVACNDQMALGVLQAAHRAGLQVPYQLGVVGFDNTPESGFYWPALTTIRHQLLEQGRIAVHKLIGMIEHGQLVEATDETDSTFLQPQLIIRNSSVIRENGKIIG